MNDVINYIINNSNIWIASRHCVKNRLWKANKVKERTTWYKLFKFGNWRIYITKNIRMKRRSDRDMTSEMFNRRDFRKHCYERSGHKCEICGKELTWETNELHHVLPVNRFLQFSMDERNMQCLCHNCHKDIHCDPYKNIRQIEAKARELGINLKEYYDV